MSEFVRLEIADGIGTLRLERPPMNALNVQVQEELRAAATEATANSEVRAVVVYGGEKVFAAGADIKEMANMSYVDMLGPRRRVDERLRLGRPDPEAGRGRGHRLRSGRRLRTGAGLRLAGRRDRRETRPAGDHARRHPRAPGGTQRLARLVGPARAKDIIMSGRFVEADEALAIGLVDQVVPAGEVYSAAVALVQRYTTGPAVALRAAKLAIDGGLDLDLASGLAWESQLFASLFATADRTEGMDAFLAKRKPDFTGR